MHRAEPGACWARLIRILTANRGDAVFVQARGQACTCEPVVSNAERSFVALPFSLDLCDTARQAHDQPRALQNQILEVRCSAVALPSAHSFGQTSPSPERSSGFWPTPLRTATMAHAGAKPTTTCLHNQRCVLSKRSARARRLRCSAAASSTKELNLTLQHTAAASVMGTARKQNEDRWDLQVRAQRAKAVFKLRWSEVGTLAVRHGGLLRCSCAKPWRSCSSD